MFFKRFAPDHELEPFIECYWIVEDDDTTPRQQKIVPDGFNEIIFHLGDPYRIRLYDQWELQSTSLLAGQIRKHFFLENTGGSNIVGIKLKPTALTHLFGLNMHQFTDKVIDLTSSPGQHFLATAHQLRETNDHKAKINLLNNHFKRLLHLVSFQETGADRAIEIIFAKHGMIPVSAIARVAGVENASWKTFLKNILAFLPNSIQELFASIIFSAWYRKIIKAGAD